MSATKELRRLLEERGVEYTVDHGYREFFWDFGESGTARASAIGTRGLVQMIVTGIAPAQAVEATLGHGTCGYVLVPAIGDGMLDAVGLRCTSCGREQLSATPPRFCPDCGRRVLNG